MVNHDETHFEPPRKGSNKEILAAAKEFKLRQARKSLIAFTQLTMPKYKVGWFHRQLAYELELFWRGIRSGAQPRTMIHAPPRSGKSELFSRRFPAWVFGQDPDIDFIGASHTAALANRMNRDVQGIIAEPIFNEIFPGDPHRGPISLGGKDRQCNSELFEISAPYKGVYKASGVGGGITGMGFTVGLIDDPCRDSADARSITVQDSVEEWYRSTFYTRQADQSGILIGMTRWAVQDLAGRLQEDMRQGKGDFYRVVNFPAISTKDEYFCIYSDSYTDYGQRHEMSGEIPAEKHLLRKEGEALHAERFPLERLLAIKEATQDGGVWSSLYQQEPVIQGGNLIKDDYWEFYDPNTLPQMEYSFVVADTALTTNERSDYSVFTCFGVYQGSLYALDALRAKLEAPDLEVQCKIFWEKQRSIANRGPMRGLHIEEAASGFGLLQKLKRTTGIPVLPYKVNKDKYTRVLDALPYIKAGQIKLPNNAKWLADFLQEARQFSADPKSNAHDDFVDTFSMAAAVMWHKKRTVFDSLYS